MIIEDTAFYKDLEFGTAGLRGIIGAGTNRMNKYTVTKATQGLANYILKTGKADKGVAIAFDSRRMSPEFAKETALCLCANGIPVYIFESLRPTPELSFALRELGCVAGVNITASHNPPEYNGYKAYWEDGAQITPPHDVEILKEVKAVTDFNNVKTMSEEDAVAAGLYHVIGKEIDDKYIETLKKLEETNQLDLFNNIEMPLVEVLASMQYEGIYIDKDELIEFGKELQEKINNDLKISCPISTFHYTGYDILNRHSKDKFNIVIKFNKMTLNP